MLICIATWSMVLGVQCVMDYANKERTMAICGCMWSTSVGAFFDENLKTFGPQVHRKPFIVYI
jgi:hypothetical protein